MRKTVIAIALAGLVALPGTSSGAGTTVRATGDRGWSPRSASVGVGGKVRWRNPDDERHTVVAYGRGWKMSRSLDEGASTSKRFKKAGTYKYRCTLHSEMDGRRCEGMCGKVKVN